MISGGPSRGPTHEFTNHIFPTKLNRIISKSLRGNYSNREIFMWTLQKNFPVALSLLRKRGTFRRLLCFRKVFSECQVCAHEEREMFYFVFYFFAVLLFKSSNHEPRHIWRCTHASIHARTLPRTHEDTHASIIALITREETLFLYRFIGVPYFRHHFLRM